MSADPQAPSLPAMPTGAQTVPIVPTPAAPKPTGCVVFEEQLEVPLNLTSLEEFRKWAVSDRFPDRGRIDFLAGRIEIDMSPENLFNHGALKTEMSLTMGQRIKRLRLGRLFIDRTRISTPAAELSAEPDLVFVSKAALAERRVVPIPYADNEPDQFIEFEGAPDLIVEIVSKNSVSKDSVRLPKLYWQAGVREFWLADARGNELSFQIHRRGEAGFEPTSIDTDDFQWSEVLRCAYRVERYRDDDGYWAYSLIEREKPE